MTTKNWTSIKGLPEARRLLAEKGIKPGFKEDEVSGGKKMEEMNEQTEQTPPQGIDDLIRHLADEAKEALIYVSTGAGVGWVGEKFLPLRYIIGPVANTIATVGGGTLGLYTWTKKRGEDLSRENIGDAVLLAGRDITIEGVMMARKVVYLWMRQMGAFTHDPEAYIDAHVIRPLEKLRKKPVGDS